jgi:hypothetical protein
MTEPLIDPLMPFFRPAAAPPPPLLLSRTDIHLWLTPPMARLRIHRAFDNQEGVPIEAVLTMPPALDGEVVHGVAVTIGGQTWTAHARAHRRGEGEYDGAAIDGNRAVFLEEAKHGWRVLSIAGIRPGERASIDCDSVVGLEVGEQEFLLRPGMDRDRSVTRLPDHQAPRRTDIHHPATLTIWATEELGVHMMGQDVPIGIPMPIDGAPLALHIRVPATVPRTASTQPADIAAETALHAARQISTLLANPAVVDRQAIRALAISANLLTAETSLVFIGPEGEASGVLPTMRKVALVDRPRSPVEPMVPAAPTVIPEASPPAPYPPEVPPEVPPVVPGRARFRLPRFRLPSSGGRLTSPGAPPPWNVRLSNWLRHVVRRRPKPPPLPELGARLVAAAPLVFWRQDGALALRSGDASHLPEAVATLVREIAVVPEVSATGRALQLAPEQLAIGLLAMAASKHAGTPPGLLGYLFPDGPDTPPPPVTSLARRMGIA